MTHTPRLHRIRRPLTGLALAASAILLGACAHAPHHYPYAEGEAPHDPPPRVFLGYYEDGYGYHDYYLPYRYRSYHGPWWPFWVDPWPWGWPRYGRFDPWWYEPPPIRPRPINPPPINPAPVPRPPAIPMPKRP